MLKRSEIMYRISQYLTKAHENALKEACRKCPRPKYIPVRKKYRRQNRTISYERAKRMIQTKISKMKRKCKIAVEVAQGYQTLEEIGKTYSISKERVRQIAAQHEVKRRIRGKKYVTGYDKLVTEFNSVANYTRYKHTIKQAAKMTHPDLYNPNDFKLVHSSSKPYLYYVNKYKTIRREYRGSVKVYAKRKFPDRFKDIDFPRLGDDRRYSKGG